MGYVVGPRLAAGIFGFGPKSNRRSKSYGPSGLKIREETKECRAVIDVHFVSHQQNLPPPEDSKFEPVIPRNRQTETP